MRVYRDDKYAAEIRQMIVDDYTARSEKENAKRENEYLIHVSDIVFPRKTYYDITQGRKMTDTAIGFWFTGVAYATELQRIMGSTFAEVEKQYDHFIAHIDHFDKALVEIKTSRKWSVPARPAPHYVRQVGFYCAMTETPSGKIVVIFPTAGRTWKGNKSSTVEIGAWELNFTADELADIRKSMKTTEQEIIKALDAHSPKNLPPCADWLLTDFNDPDPGKYSEAAEERNPFYYIDMVVMNE